jgi:hypothetical protein
MGEVGTFFLKTAQVHDHGKRTKEEHANYS